MKCTVSVKTQREVYKQLSDARMLTHTAFRDLTQRGDRIDALDSIAAAKRALVEAETKIRTTLPKGMRVGEAKCECPSAADLHDCPIHGG